VARSTLEILIPAIKEKLPDPILDDPAGTGTGTAGSSTSSTCLDCTTAGCPDLNFFDEIRVEDPRVSDLCARTSEPPPYLILLTCLQRYQSKIVKYKDVSSESGVGA
jgi:microprocessor complex subunit DGCR8